MHCSKTWIKLHRFLDFAHTRILPKTCPTLSWDQALLSFSWVNRFQAGKQATRYPRQIDKHASNTKSCTNRENNERNGEQVLNFEDLYKLKLISIVLSSTHPFRTRAFLLVPLSSFSNFYAYMQRYAASEHREKSWPCTIVKKADWPEGKYPLIVFGDFSPPTPIYLRGDKTPARS